MDRLRRFSRADRYHLRHVHLKTGSVTKDLFRDSEYQRIHHELAGGRGSRDQPARTLRAPSLEFVFTGGGSIYPGAKFGSDLIHQLRRDEPIDYYSAIPIDRGESVLAAGICIKVQDSHSANLGLLFSEP
jgi:hypothetical protein